MPVLRCNVKTCLHNEDEYCCKGKILVEGENATSARATCCSSFDERTGETFKNRYETPDTHLAVSCEAVNCIYNKKKKCVAEHITISGNQASIADETECASFTIG